MTRRSLAAPLVGTKRWAHGEQSALPHTSRTRTLPRPPQARLANVTTTRSPLKDEPGWATHTPFPNFGKVEYFCGGGLTGGDTEEVRSPDGAQVLSGKVPNAGRAAPDAPWSIRPVALARPCIHYPSCHTLALCLTCPQNSPADDGRGPKITQIVKGTRHG